MRIIAVCISLLTVVTCLAQDTRLAQEETVRYARLCVEQTNLGDAPFAMAADAEKACAERGEGGGVMIIPDKKLTAKSILQVGKDIVPVGQLWLRKWTLVENDAPVPLSKLRVLSLNIDDKQRPMPLCLLGIRKLKDELQLVVYAKESEPFQTLPLKKVDFEQELPVLLEWQRGERGIDRLTVRICGKLETILPVTRQ